MRFQKLAVFVAFAVIAANQVIAQDNFSDQVGPVQVGPTPGIDKPVKINMITWGGEAGLLVANGGLKTSKDSIYGKMGLNINLVVQDNPVLQVKDYLGGISPSFRSTMRMSGIASAALNRDSKTVPICPLQLSWSAGDHLLVKDSIKRIDDLKGKKVAIQKNGPHVGLLSDALKTVGMSFKDIEVVWVSDLTGPNGPAELFRKDQDVVACTVITPDMLQLVGSLDAIGNGKDGTLSGAHVLVSTAQLTRSIADVIYFRSDFVKANPQWVEKFVAGYLAGCEEVIKLRDEFEKTGKLSANYENLLQTLQDVFGEDVLPILEEDAHGLLLDCRFARLPGNVQFFLDPSNLQGFDQKSQGALEVAKEIGAIEKQDTPKLIAASLDYKKIASMAGVEYVEPKVTRRIAAEGLIFNEEELDQQTLASFTVPFPANSTTIDGSAYAKEFDQVIDAITVGGGVSYIVRGHTDPSMTLSALIGGGIKKGIIQRTGTKGDRQYFYQGKPLDISDTKSIANLIEKGAFDGLDPNPRDVYAVAMSLSEGRAKSFVSELVEYAKTKGITIDPTQVKAEGVGIREPIIPKPSNLEQTYKNMRVEFRLVKVKAEFTSDDEFDF